MDESLGILRRWSLDGCEVLLIGKFSGWDFKAWGIVSELGESGFVFASIEGPAERRLRVSIPLPVKESRFATEESPVTGSKTATLTIVPASGSTLSFFEIVR
jgi:hypothetical protein